MDRYIEKMARNGTTCVKTRSMTPPKPPVDWPMAQEIWSRVHVDFAGPLNGAIILVAMDSHTKWIEPVTMPQAMADAAIAALREIVRRLGIPKVVSGK